MHGGHHVAQKFRTNSLPPKSERVKVRPASVLIANFGAESPTLTTGASSVPATTQTSAAESIMTEPAKSQSVRRFTLSF